MSDFNQPPKPEKSANPAEPQNSNEVRINGNVEIIGGVMTVNGVPADEATKRAFDSGRANIVGNLSIVNSMGASRSPVSNIPSPGRRRIDNDVIPTPQAPKQGIIQDKPSVAEQAHKQEEIIPVPKPPTEKISDSPKEETQPELPKPLVHAPAAERPAQNFQKIKQPSPPLNLISKLKKPPMKKEQVAPLFEKRREKLIQGLRERFKSNEIDITSEKDFAKTFWGAEASADVLFITEDQKKEAIEFIRKEGFNVPYTEEMGGIYIGDLNLIFVKRQPEIYGDLDDFFTRSKVVHELTHATLGRAKFVASMEDFQLGDALLEINRTPTPGTLLSSAIDPVKPRTGFASTGSGNLEKAYGFFLEEGCAVISEFEWIKAQAESDKVPERARDTWKKMNSGEVLTLATLNDGQEIQVPWYAWRMSKEEGNLIISGQRFAAMGLELLFEADPSLIQDFKEARQGKVEALRKIPLKIESLLGDGFYKLLRTRQRKEESQDQYYISRYKKIKEILEKRKAVKE